MHGGYYVVAAANPSNRSVVVASTSGFPFDQNVSLTFYSADMECWGTSLIQSLYSVTQPPETEGRTKTGSPGMKYDDADFMQVSAALIMTGKRQQRLSQCCTPL